MKIPFFFIVSGFLLSVSSLANDSTLIRLKNSKLPVVDKKPLTFSSVGQEIRAEELNEIFKKANDFFDKQVGTHADYSLAILSKGDWMTLSYLPYGVYHGTDSPHVLFLPAQYQDGNLPAPSTKIANELSEMGFSLLEAEKINHNFRSIHELGHLVAEKIPIAFFPGKPNKWFNEFIASYLAYAFYMDKFPKQAAVVRVMTSYNDERNYSPKYTRIADFETLYNRVGPENYGWFQNEFLKLIYDIYEKSGVGFIRKLVEANFIKNEKMTVEALIDQLEKVTPGFKEWSLLK